MRERQHDVYARRERIPEEVAVRAAVRVAVDAEERDWAAKGRNTSVSRIREAAADAAGDIVTRMLQPSPLAEALLAEAERRALPARVLIPPERQGWRARLANVERLLDECRPEEPLTWQLGELHRRELVTEALAEVRALIDFDQPSTEEVHANLARHADLVTGRWRCHATPGDGALGRCAWINEADARTCAHCGTPRPL